jgi:hypothetical protein
VDVRALKALNPGLPRMTLYLDRALITEKAIGMVRDMCPSPMVNGSVILPKGVATSLVNPTSVVRSSSSRFLASLLRRIKNVRTLF